MTDTSSEEFFEQKYAAAVDPWAFETSRYERERYGTIISALGDRRYKRAFEPGCSIGILTRDLADLCDRVEAIDISSRAVARARERCCGLDNVKIAQGKLPDAIPPGSFDLIVLSEIGYYFAPEVLLEIASQLVARLTSNGVLLAAHWLGRSPDHQLGGDEVHALLGSIPEIERTLAERHEGFRLERWTRI
jgi:SAM-dependent methyltransferase